MGIVYQIIDWDKHYENFKSRTVMRCGYVCVPNKQHGEGLRFILSQPDGSSIYGIFNLIIGACSQHKPPRSGWLTNDGTEAGKPWTSDSLAMRWWRTTPEVQRALDVLSSSDVGWILQGYREDTTVRPELKGIEEGKGKEDSCPPESGDVFPPGMLKFWNSYPQKGRDRSSRKQVHAVWKKQKLEPKATEVLRGLELWKRSSAWLEQDGRFVKNAHVWLSSGKWTEPPERDQQTGHYHDPSPERVEAVLGGST